MRRSDSNNSFALPPQAIVSAHLQGNDSAGSESSSSISAALGFPHLSVGATPTNLAQSPHATPALSALSIDDAAAARDISPGLAPSGIGVRSTLFSTVATPWSSDRQTEGLIDNFCRHTTLSREEVLSLLMAAYDAIVDPSNGSLNENAFESWLQNVGRRTFNGSDDMLADLFGTLMEIWFNERRSMQHPL